MTSPVAARPQTHVQSRIEQETALRMERRNGSPDEIPEIQREIQMAKGAIHGVEQRLGELVAKLQPVMHPKQYSALISGDDGVMRSEDSMMPMSEYGQQIRELHYAIGAVEHVLSYLGQGVAT